MQSLVLFIVSGVGIICTISGIASSQRHWRSCILLLLILLLLLLFSPSSWSGDRGKIAETILGGRLTFLARPK